MIDSTKLDNILPPYDDEVINKATSIRRALKELEKAGERMSALRITGFSMQEVTVDNVEYLRTVATYENGKQFKYDYPLTENMMNQGIQALIEIYSTNLQKQIDELPE